MVDFCVSKPSASTPFRHFALSIFISTDCVLRESRILLEDRALDNSVPESLNATNWNLPNFHTVTRCNTKSSLSCGVEGVHSGQMTTFIDSRKPRDRVVYLFFSAVSPPVDKAANHRP